MPAKAPIYLKPSSRKGKKCRLRDILSPDMISPPLGDFRHTIHIGKGGERDTFGDMSFLQGKYELLAGKGDPLPQFAIQGEFLRANSTGDASFAETPSPVLKNAISLPTIGGCQALTLPLIPATVFPMPPEPMQDLTGPIAPLKPDSPEEVEMLQMDVLLRSMEVFSCGPSPSSGVQSKPDVLLDLLDGTGGTPCEAVAKANKINKSEARFENPLSYFNHSTFRTNGSLTSNTSSDSFDSLTGKVDSHKTCSRIITYGHFSSGFQQSAPSSGEWGDQDCGAEEGRICNLDIEFSKEKSPSPDPLAQIAGSFMSLELDLGPSILDEVLNIMDKPAVKSRP